MAQVIKKVTANGDQATWVLKVCNDSSIKCHNGKVTFTIPNGVSLTGPSNLNSTVINVPHGYYDNVGKIWYLGDLESQTCSDEASFEFTVDNITLADPLDDRFTITAVFTTSCEETVTSDNTSTLIIEVVDDCENISLSMTSSVSPTSADLSLS